MLMFENVHIAPHDVILLYPKRNNKLIYFLKISMLVNLLKNYIVLNSIKVYWLNRWLYEYLIFLEKMLIVSVCSLD